MRPEGIMAELAKNLSNVRDGNFEERVHTLAGNNESRDLASKRTQVASISDHNPSNIHLIKQVPESIPSVKQVAKATDSDKRFGRIAQVTHRDSHHLHGEDRGPFIFIEIPNVLPGVCRPRQELVDRAQYLDVLIDLRSRPQDQDLSSIYMFSGATIPRQECHFMLQAAQRAQHFFEWTQDGAPDLPGPIIAALACLTGFQKITLDIRCCGSETIYAELITRPIYKRIAGNTTICEALGPCELEKPQGRTIMIFRPLSSTDFGSETDGVESESDGSGPERLTDNTM